MPVRRLWLVFLLVLPIGCERKIVINIPELEYSTPNNRQLADWYAEFNEYIARNRFELRPRSPISQTHGEPVLSFVHISDVQLRDYGIHYFGHGAEKIADMVAGGTEHKPHLDRNDEYPFLALIGALNNLSEESRPAFVIHTGDTADSSSVGELMRFVALANTMLVPWYAVLGNHDVFLMGNFTNDGINIENANAAGIAWILNRERFMRHLGANDDFNGPPLIHTPTELQSKMTPSSRYHGFDCLNEECTKQCTNGICPLRAYYSFRVTSKLPIRVIVLDTTVKFRDIPSWGSRELPAYGAFGYIEEEQFRWLKDQVEDARRQGEMVIVFGHHPLSLGGQKGFLLGWDPDGARDVQLVGYLKRQPHVLGYFGGHTHYAQLQRYQDDARGNLPFLEMTAPSMHDFPQVGLWINIWLEGSAVIIETKAIKGVVLTKGVVADREHLACEGGIEEADVRRTECWQEDTRKTDTIVQVAQYTSNLPIVTRTSIVEGEYQYRDPIVTDRIVFRAGTIVHCSPGKGIHMTAAAIEIEGPVTFSCAGVDGAPGSRGMDRGGWCVAADHRLAEDEYRNGGNEPGGPGGPGGPGSDGSPIDIQANEITFRAGARVTFDTHGGQGGRGGPGGKGRGKALAPSSDDCHHGTNFIATAQAADGPSGQDGARGRDGVVTINTKRISGDSVVTVNGSAQGIRISP